MEGTPLTCVVISYCSCVTPWIGKVALCLVSEAGCACGVGSGGCSQEHCEKVCPDPIAFPRKSFLLSFHLSSSIHLFSPCAMSCLYVMCVNICMSCFPVFCFCELTLIQPCPVFLDGKAYEKEIAHDNSTPCPFSFRSQSSPALPYPHCSLCRCENEILFPSPLVALFIPILSFDFY